MFDDAGFWGFSTAVQLSFATRFITCRPDDSTTYFTRHADHEFVGSLPVVSMISNRRKRLSTVQVVSVPHPQVPFVLFGADLQSLKRGPELPAIGITHVAVHSTSTIYQSEAEPSPFIDRFRSRPPVHLDREVLGFFGFGAAGRGLSKMTVRGDKGLQKGAVGSCSVHVQRSLPGWSSFVRPMKAAACSTYAAC